MRYALAVALVIVAACGAQDHSTGTVAFTMTRPAFLMIPGSASSTVASITLSVQQQGGTTTTQSIPTDVSSYTVKFPALEVGNYTFSVVAVDGTGAVLFSGSASANVTRNAVINLNIVVQQATAPVTFYDDAPAITSMSLTDNAGSPVVGDTVLVIASASDVDNNAMTFAWTSSCADDIWMGQTSAIATVQLAADCGTSRTLTFSATDSKNVTSSASMIFAVAPYPTGEVDVNVTFNSFPNILSITSPDAQCVPGGTISIVAVAQDDDGDSITPSWSSNCSGATFDNANTLTPTFHAPPTAPPSGSCSVVLTVSDGRGGTNQGQLNVNVVAL
ncbi:MAG TPA: hypothetical protein VMG32_03405 [Anaeromyxobacteraceae bacterium]|nr:hypothetical protein [Anaeromyxobacteraceae bacterium]